MSIISTGQSYKNSSKGGIAESANIETNRNNANKALEAQENQAKSTNIGMGLGMGVAKAGAVGGLYGVGFALLVNELSFDF
ncbi:MAG: hypothetical protein OEX07_07665 [Gammaproteobacteria bacterium]|nr:hypothetical protein [Gammaproteobacteria bacterium]